MRHSPTHNAMSQVSHCRAEAVFCRKLAAVSRAAGLLGKALLFDAQALGYDELARDWSKMIPPVLVA